MSDAVQHSLALRRVSFNNGTISFSMRDGKKILRELTEYPRLARATAEQRSRYELLDRGLVAHWPNLDEHVGVAQLLGISERTAERRAGHDVRSVLIDTVIRQGERKQEIADEISMLVGRPPRLLGRGSKELKALLTDIVEVLSLPISSSASKPDVAAAIVRSAGMRWTRDSDSRRTPSGGGSTITRAGLQRLRDAVAKLASPTPR